MSGPRPHWIIRDQTGARVGSADRKQTALNLADKLIRPFRRRARIEHPNGEIWERRQGSWFKIAARVPRREDSAA